MIFFFGFCLSCNFITKQNVSQSSSASVFRYTKAPNLMAHLGTAILIHSAAKHKCCTDSSEDWQCPKRDHFSKGRITTVCSAVPYVKYTQIAEGWKVRFSRVSTLLPVHLWLSLLYTNHSNRILSFYINLNVALGLINRSVKVCS